MALPEQQPLPLGGVDPTGSATLSDDALYRYTLTRRWGAGEATIQFVMLNPSTADAQTDDRTIGRCRDFARREGADGLSVVNLYAYRATRPADLWLAADPVGPDNDAVLSASLREAAARGWPVVAAWGGNARPERVQQVRAMAQRWGTPLLALAVNKDGSPKHPLYVRGDSPLTAWA